MERLENRWVFAAPSLTSSMPDQLTLFDAAPLQIPLDGADADGDALSYQVSSDNPNVVAVFHQGNRSMRIHVVHDGDGTAADPAFEGDLVLELFEDQAPRTTGHIIELINDGFYNDIIFHRIVENFVIQGGDPTGTGSGGSDNGEFDDEFFPDLQHTSRGILSMAKSDDDTNDSQFFITLEATRNLDFNHSIFGRLVEGDDILEKISNVALGLNDPEEDPGPNNPVTRPVSPVTMESVTLFTDTQNKVLTLKSAAGAAAGQTATITVTANDGQGGTVQKVFTVTTAADTNDNQPYLLPLNPGDNGVVRTKVNTPVTVTLMANDVDAGSAAFFATETLAPTANLSVSIDNATGVLTITPKPGVTGVHSLRVGVRDGVSEFDIQTIPIYISPGATAAPDLAVASDTGTNTSDNVTRLDNSSVANALQFTFTNLVAGADVQLFDGPTMIGFATAAGGATSVTVTTNGFIDLADGQHTITAKQILSRSVNVGNFHSQVDLTSDASAPLVITIDTAPPVITSTAPTTGQVGQLFNYDVQATGEGTAGFAFSLVQSPTNASIAAATGVITWAPSAAQSGNQSFTVRATDAAGNFVDQSFTVDVEQSDNEPPTIDNIGAKTAHVGELLTFVVTATDPDSPASAIRFELGPGAPAGAAIDAATGAFTWTPAGNQVGQHSISVVVRDEVSVAQQAFTVTVTPPPATFQVIGGTLTINGTAGNDTVTIAGTTVPGQLQITSSLGNETVSGVTGDLRVLLLGGNDQLKLNNVFVAGEIVLDLGEGNDVLGIGDSAATSSAKNFTVMLGGGDDTLRMQRVFVGRDMLVDAGAGADMVASAGVANGAQFWLGSSSAGATTMRGGEGDDQFQISYSFIVGAWKVEGGGGNDSINMIRSACSHDVTISGGDGNDFMAVDTNFFVTAVVLNGGNGHDGMLLRSSIVTQSATLLGGEGSDVADVINISARGVMVVQGGGYDRATIQASVMQNLFADLGQGDDALVVRWNRLLGMVDVDGADGGGDQIASGGNLMLGSFRKRRFELGS